MGVRWSRMSWTDKNELWTRWRQGESLRDIGHALRRATSVVYAAVGAEGGIAPQPRRRSRLALTTTEREELSRQLARGESLRTISRLLARAPSTVSREVARNGGRRVYRATAADGQAWRRSRRPQPCRLSTRPTLRRTVARKLAQQWSPQQISGWLRCIFPSDADMPVSPETIYRSLFVQSRGVLKRCRHAGTGTPCPSATSGRDEIADLGRGSELAAHRAFTMATTVQVYFCDPQSPWQRGANENTNGLLRQYLPPAANISGYSQAQLDAIALRLNTRPRMTLGYGTPAAQLAEIVATTG